MLFKSPFGAYSVKVRSALPRYNARGEVISERRALRAEFGRWVGDEQMVANPLDPQHPIPSAELVGHFFDTDAWYQEAVEGVTNPDELELLAEEKEYMEFVLQREARNKPGQLQLVQKVAVAAPRPWLTYDAQTAEEVVDAAQLLGMVREAVAYERNGLQRPDVLSVLEPLLDGPLPEAEEGYEEGALDVPVAAGVSIGKAQERTQHGMMLNTPRIEL